MVNAVKLNIQEDLDDGWKELETHFQVECARLNESVRNALLRWFSDAQSSLGKISALFSSRVAKALDVGSSSSKMPSVCTEKAWKPRIASCSKRATKPVEGPSSGNGNVYVEPVQVNLL